MNLLQAVRDQLPGVRADLDALVSVASISADPDRAAEVARSARQVADLLTGAGCPEVEVVEAGGGPAVIARYPAPAGAP
ncbi:MAG: dipeptidase, partial [Microlunatus sp.]|nr:dipeptidase [Microlunatus sp.]